ncbi:MAG: hypothetical protein WEB88_05585 [Gemmatimonadota bacterium]
MDSFLLFPLYVLVVVMAGFASVLMVRWVFARRRARRRVVERPNSHYTSEGVRRNETRSRWHAIDRARLHEINRGEVERLLARVDAAGPESLRADERRFLDYLVELTGGAPDDAAGSDAAGPRDPPRGTGGASGARALPDSGGG